MDETYRANRYMKTMRELESERERREYLEEEITEVENSISTLEEQLAEQWGEMGDYARNRVGLWGAER